MLSVLIPTYDYDTSKLVEEIHSQCVATGIDFEILCQDDASGSPLNFNNEKINALQFARFYINEQNLGRGLNINSLAEKAKSEWLLILDSDVFPTKTDFIANYTKLMNKSGVMAVYGGICYKKEKPEPAEMLRWVYGSKREAVPHLDREKNPYQTTLTSNILIRRSVFNSNPFHNDIHEYGYEDMVFTAGLKKHGIDVLQAENPVYHLNLETSPVYMEKIHTALRNLFYLMNKGLITKTESDIIKLYRRIGKFGLDKMTAFFFKRIQNSLLNQLLSENPKLLLLDIYKIGYFCSLKR